LAQPRHLPFRKNQQARAFRSIRSTATAPSRASVARKSTTSTGIGHPATGWSPLMESAASLAEPLDRMVLPTHRTHQTDGPVGQHHALRRGAWPGGHQVHFPEICIDQRGDERDAVGEQELHGHVGFRMSCPPKERNLNLRPNTASMARVAASATTAGSEQGVDTRQLPKYRSLLALVTGWRRRRWMNDRCSRSRNCWCDLSCSSPP
jgi:hypothetical protein